MRFHQTFNLFNKKWLVLVQCMNIPKAGTVGISARVPHTLHYVTFLDYDRITDKRLIDELIVLQEVFPGHLGDFHVFYTREFGRHAMCIDRLFFRENKDVVYASSCDYEYKWGWRINEGRTWIARVLEKGERDRPKYLYSIPSPYNGLRLQSQAHGMFLEYFYGADVRLTNPDGNTELEIQRYKTSSNIKLEDLVKKYKPSTEVKLKDVQKEAKMVQRG